MQVHVEYGRQAMELQIADRALVPSHIAANPDSVDPTTAMRQALEAPFQFPPLYRILTPDDRVAILVDERLPQLPLLLTALLRQVLRAGVDTSQITLLCSPSSAGQPWLEELPEDLEEVHCEVHDPKTRNKLAYVANLRRGRQLYLNRTLVDAGQTIVLTSRRYDLVTGMAGTEAVLYPALGDEAARGEAAGRLTLNPDAVLHAEAVEAAWLLGVPFFVQVVEGPGDSIWHIVAGVGPALDEGRRLQESAWRRTVARPADTVIATLAGDPARHTFADFADALGCASRVLRPHGRVILLSGATPEQTAGTALLRQAEDPTAALKKIAQARDYELRAAWQWASVAQQARVYLVSGWADEVVEELFATPLAGVEQVQRLVSAGESCLILGDAHKTLAVVEG